MIKCGKYTLKMKINKSPLETSFIKNIRSSRKLPFVRSTESLLCDIFIPNAFESVLGF